MGCEASCLHATPPTPFRGGSGMGSGSLNTIEEASEGSNRMRDVTHRRTLFIRSASSSASSLTSSAMLLNGSKKKRRGKKRTFVPMSTPSNTNSRDGVEISRAIIGEVSTVLDVIEVVDKLVKEDVANQPQAPLLPISPAPQNMRSTSSVSRFLTRKTALKGGEDQGMEASSHQEDTPGSHRRQASNDNFFLRLPSTASLSSMTSGHKRTGSFELLQKTSNGTEASPLVGHHTSSGGSVGVLSPKEVSALPPPAHVGHRRQGSESSMFSRIVRVSSLTATADPEPSLYTSPAPVSCSTKALKAFLEKENCDTLTEEEIENWKSKILLATAPRSTFIMGEDRWTFHQIQEYLYSSLNEAKDEKYLAMQHDMSRPMSEYFVSTSHNTYLFGGQWITTGGKVDLQMYARALRQGCRCVEIDIYDGPEGDPMVTHVSPAWSGGSITFLEVCALIAKEGFRDSRGSAPLILNLENNMSKQSKRAAEILTGAFGSRLVRVNDPEFGWDKTGSRQTFPSPSDLAGRVICRSKPRDSSEEYQNLIYFRNSPWRFSNPDEFGRRKYYQTSSLSESKVKGALKKVPSDVSPIELNRAFLNRVYPRASAYASQNFSPLPYWLLGFQLVALNFQTDGVEMDLNRCMFERNGGSGFVIKPALMRRARQHSRMNGGVRMSSRNMFASTLSTSRSVLRSSGLVGNDSSPMNANQTLSSRTGGFLLSSSRFSSRPFSDPIKSETTSVPERILERNENSKSFMGVVEEALKNQNEDEDLNEDEDDLPPPPPLASTGPVAPAPGSTELPPLHISLVSAGGGSSSSGVTSTLVSRNSTKLAPPSSSRSRLSPPSMVEQQTPKSSGEGITGGDSFFSTASNAGVRPLSHTSDTYSESPDIIPRTILSATTASDVDSFNSNRTAPINGNNSQQQQTTSSVRNLDSDQPSFDEEKKRRARARRRSTGSILKASHSESSESAPLPTSRKRSLEDAGSSRDLAGTPPLSPLARNSSFYDEDSQEEKVALNSVLIQFLSVKCNVNRERVKTASTTTTTSTAAPSTASGAAATTATDLPPRRSGGGGDSLLDEDDESPDEEVFIELAVDGHPLDRVEKRTVGTVQLKGTQPTKFADREEIAAVLKDSETALFTIRLVDAWDGSSRFVASRSFFAHCLLPGVRELILLGDSGNAGYPIPYTVTCKISTMYSIFSRSTGKFELEDKVEPPVLHCPSKLSMIHCVVVGCRSENPKLKISSIDPFVSVQVFGIPLDSREMRTPKASRISRTASPSIISAAATSSTAGATAILSGATSSASHNSSFKSTNPVNSATAGARGVSSASSGVEHVPLGSGAGGHVSSGNALPSFPASVNPVGGASDIPNTVSWMFPLVLTFAWSEFAFLRFCLRTSVNIDPDTGAVYGTTSTSSSRRRGSLVFRSNPTPTNASLAAGAAASSNNQTSAAPSQVIESGYVVGKNLLWADAIRPGYRSIPLYLEKSPDVQVATLLCHFTLFEARDRTFGPNKEDSEGSNNNITPTSPKKSLATVPLPRQTSSTVVDSPTRVNVTTATIRKNGSTSSSPTLSPPTGTAAKGSKIVGKHGSGHQSDEQNVTRNGALTLDDDDNNKEDEITTSIVCRVCSTVNIHGETQCMVCSSILAREDRNSTARTTSADVE